jgi:tRNA-splicing ligase RtcB
MNTARYEWFDGHRVGIKAWTRGVPVETAAMNQLYNLTSLPFVHRHVAAMPDVHWGMGATVGSVIATKGAIIPAAVGVDIGCGMMAVRTSLTAGDLPDSLAALRSAIEAAVPHGRTNNGGPGDKGAHAGPQHVPVSLLHELHQITDKFPKLARPANRVATQFATLGTGNHFIEVCLDEEQHVWVMLHSGSRGMGNAIGSHFIEVAKREMEKWFVSLPDADLAYLPQGSEHFTDYCRAVAWAQSYARANREAMMDATIDAIEKALDLPQESVDSTSTAVNCHHNYVAWENHFGEDVLVTRKGAVSARLDEFGIIPGSMGAKSFIVRGKGNPESFHSCSHGAGRRMSRGEAKRTFTVADHEAATAGVECRKDEGVIDETPAAYKDIDAVMAAQADLVEIVHTLKQVLCVKG